LLDRLARTARDLRRRRIVEACLTALGLVAGALLLFDALDRLLSFREPTALVVGGLAVVLVLLRFGGQLLRVLLFPPHPEELALAVENAHPELMDSYVCAVELEIRNGRSLRPLEKTLHDSVAAGTASLDLSAVLIPPGLRTGRLAFAGLLFCALAALAGRSGFVQKARWELADRLRGEHTGLVVTPGNTEIAENSDVTIAATVRRWQNTAEIVTLTPEGSRRFRMTRPTPGRGGRTHTFTLYAVDAPVRYRILTPSLASAWFRIDPYRPPAIRRSRIEIVPPAYTGVASREITDLQDFSAPVGSRVRFSVEPTPGAAVTLLWGRDRRRLAPTTPGAARSVSCELRKSVTFAVTLRDREGHRTRTPDFRAESIPDRPPAIDVLEPGRDVQVLPDAVVRTVARAADDLGLARVELTFSVSGRDRRTLTPPVLPPAPGGAGGAAAPGKPGPTRQTVAYRFDVKALGAREGDVLAYSFVAVDNRSPDPQKARSEIFFIEVRPKITPRSGGAGGQKKKMDIGPLIAEIKRLIRVTYDALALTGPDRRARTRTLVTGLSDLRTAAARKLQEIRAAVGPGGSGPIGALLGEAVAEIEQAKQLAATDLIEESLSPQERALARLIALENQLLKNAAAGSRGGKGKASQGKPQRKRQESSRQTDSVASRAEQMEALQNAIRELRNLARRQAELNREAGRPQGEPAAAAAKLGADQAALRADTARVGKTLERVPETARPRQSVQSATAAMAAAQRALSTGAFETGERQGRRSHAFLLAAIRRTEDAYRRASANAVEQLAAAAQGLSEQERSAARASAKLDRKSAVTEAETTVALRSQRSIGEESKRLEKAVGKVANALEERYPQASEAIGRARQSFAESGAPGRMTRAANAIRYRRFQRAARYQTDAANELLKLAGNLRKAAQLLPALSREEIEAAAAQLRQAAREARALARETDSETGQRLDQLRRDTGADLDRLASGLRDRGLRQAADALSLPFSGGDNRQNGARLAQVIAGAARVLEKRIAALDLRQRTRLFRQAAVPPEKYRPLVEEYFKDLSESQ